MPRPHVLDRKHYERMRGFRPPYVGVKPVLIDLHVLHSFGEILFCHVGKVVARN